MMKVGKMRQLWELRRADFWLAMIALVGVLVVPTLQALGIAVVASLARPHLARQRAAPDLPGPGQRRAGAARPANGPGVGRAGPGHGAP